MFSLNFPHSNEALVNAQQKKNNGKEKQKKGGDRVKSCNFVFCTSMNFKS